MNSLNWILFSLHLVNSKLLFISTIIIIIVIIHVGLVAHFSSSALVKLKIHNLLTKQTIIPFKEAFQF